MKPVTTAWTSGGTGDRWRDRTERDGALHTVTPDLTTAPLGTMMMPFLM
jgi:hypothetical protein